jgi:hypothetical protein
MLNWASQLVHVLQDTLEGKTEPILAVTKSGYVRVTALQ